MLRQLAILGLLFVGCSEGTLDLDDEKRKNTQDSYPSSGTALTTYVEMNQYAENGVSLFGSSWADSTSELPPTNDQLLLPRDPTGPFLRRAGRWVVPEEDRYKRAVQCGAETVGVFEAQEDCAENHVCGLVRPQSVASLLGPSPCPEAEAAYTVDYVPGRDVVTLGFASGIWTEVTRVTAAYAGAWKEAAAKGAPREIVDPIAEVVGTKVLVFGRAVGGSFDGAFYDPALDLWTPIKKDDMPSGGGAFRTIWTGSSLLVFTSNGGALFDPANNVWLSMKKEGAPAFDGTGFAAAYDSVDKRVFLYGNGQGGGGTKFSIGAIYDVANNSWSNLDTAGGPEADEYVGGAWTGSEFLVWSADADGRYFYYPQTRQWIEFNTVTKLNYSSTTADPSRVISFGGNVAIVPERLWFDARTRQWKSDFLPYWFNTKSAIHLGPTGLIATAVTEGDQPFERATAGAIFGGDLSHERPVFFPATPSAPKPKSGGAFARVGDFLFVYGGCETYVNDRCQVFSDKGAVVKLLPYGKAD